MSTAEIVVVGAGPAGAAAATHLARAGRDVLLVDRAQFPRDKCCGDGLTTGALRELEALGLRPDDVESWRGVDEAVLRSPSGREISFPFPADRGVFAAVARRRDLDAALVEIARRAGATVVEGHAVTAVSDAGDHVRVAIDGVGDVAARYVVAADGMWSPVRRSLGLGVPDADGAGAYLGEWHAFRQYFCGVGERAATELMVWFEPDLLPGYAWSFPLPGGRANVGFGIQRGGAIRTRSMAALWPELLARPHIAAFLGPDAVAESSHRAWPIPARAQTMPLAGAGGRVLFVGDAAAATDPMTGEGIGQALVTGRWAADAISRAGAGHPALAATLYQRAVADELLPDALLSRLLGRVLKLPIGARLAVRAAGATDLGRRAFALWLFEACPRAVIATPRRWSSTLGAGQGAWAHGPGHSSSRSWDVGQGAQETKHALREG
ncbi:MAG: geranylgeranyl reductase family protein [Acidobacteria bacterium]|nr:geranylgeranyl reductase family protein [Acidobacteriota bacterium]